MSRADTTFDTNDPNTMSLGGQSSIFCTIPPFPRTKCALTSKINILGNVPYKLFCKSANNFGRDMEEEDRADEGERKNEDNKWISEGKLQHRVDGRRSGTYTRRPGESSV